MSRGLGEAAKLAATRAREKVQDAQATPIVTPKTQKMLGVKEPKRSAAARGSYYISLDVLTQLDFAQIKIRQLLPQTSRGDLNKSKLVALAMQIAFEDLETRGERAELVQRLKPR